MIAFQIDPKYPEQTLECCSTQLAVLVDLLSQPTPEFDLSHDARSGMADTLCAIQKAMAELQSMDLFKNKPNLKPV